MLAERSQVEPCLDLVPSVEWGEHRWHAVFRKLHYRPLTETFHEFLIHVIKWTFGQTWWKHQIKMEPEQRHVVVRWTYDFAEITNRYLDDEYFDGVAYSAPASGPARALLQLGYDLYCLQAKNRLPDFLADRLRKHDGFQSARYEISCAAIMLRAGFEIQYLDEALAISKHCEFIAIHPPSGIKIGVEAKSRVRPGVLNQRGSFDYQEDFRGIQNLFKKATKQRPDGMPFVIFIDVNLPPSPGVPFSKKPWLVDVRRAIGGEPSVDAPDLFTMLFVTNFAVYFGSADEEAPNTELSVVVPRICIEPFVDVSMVNVLIESVDRYSHIPDDM